MVVLIALALIVGGLFLVHLDTRMQWGGGPGVPILRGLGWLIAACGGLVMLGLITGRGG